MAWYPKARRKNIPPPKSDPPITPRVVILHVADTEASTLYNYFNGPSGGVESHFYVLYDGTVEQYRDTGYQADANVDANGFAISIETQGKANGTWTDKQLAAIKDLILWANATHKIPLQKCPAWNGSGIGYHTQYPSRWDKRGAVCPGPKRIDQFNKVIVPWLKNPKEDDLPSVQDVVKGVMSAKVPRPDNTPVTVESTLTAVLMNTYRTHKIVAAALSPEKLSAAVAAGVKAAQANVNVDELAKAIVRELVKEAE